MVRSAAYDGVFAGGPQTSTDGYAARKTNYMASVSWKFDPDATLYARAAQGLRPGQGQTLLPPTCRNDLINAGFDPDHPPTQVNPDSVWNYEAGVKSQLMNHRIGLNGTVFWVDWKDIQQSLLLLNCGFVVLANAGTARSRGAELEFTYAPSDRWELNLSGSFTDAKLLTNQPQLGASAGDRVQEVPRIQGGASLVYRFPMPQSYRGYIRADAQYVSDSWLSFQQTDPLLHKPAYTLAGLRFGVEGEHAWQYALFVDNLFDKRADLSHPDSLSFNLSDRPRIVVSRPRTIGVSVRHSW